MLAAAACALLPASAQAADACPNGWSPEERVEFAPPVPAVTTDVGNPEREDGCTLLDVIWEPEPFAGHGKFAAHVARTTEAFVGEGLLTPSEADVVRAAAGRSQVGTSADRQLDNTCPSRIAFSFDDGTSFYRPQTLQLLRDLIATAASGAGWTCSGTTTVRCTRAEILAPGAAYAPITITVDVAANAPSLVTNAPRVVGHGGVWQDSASDPIEVVGAG